MGGVHFSPRAVRANEEAVRKSFAAKPGDDPLMLSKSRMGLRLGPAYIRAALDEINRGVPAEVYQPAVLSIIGWMLANTVAPIADPEGRMKALGHALGMVEAEALMFAMGNDVVEPGPEAYGEPGGHA